MLACNLDSLLITKSFRTTKDQLIQAAIGIVITITNNALLPQEQGYLFVFVSNEMERLRNSPNPLKNIKKGFGQSKGAISCSNPSPAILAVPKSCSSFIMANTYLRFYKPQCNLELHLAGDDYSFYPLFEMFLKISSCSRCSFSWQRSPNYYPLLPPM